MADATPRDRRIGSGEAPHPERETRPVTNWTPRTSHAKRGPCNVTRATPPPRRPPRRPPPTAATAGGASALRRASAAGSASAATWPRGGAPRRPRRARPATTRTRAPWCDAGSSTMPGRCSGTRSAPTAAPSPGAAPSPSPRSRRRCCPRRATAAELVSVEGATVEAPAAIGARSSRGSVSATAEHHPGDGPPIARREELGAELVTAGASTR